MQRLFAVLFLTETFWRHKRPSQLFAVLFWLPTKLEAPRLFCHLSGDILASKTKKGRQKAVEPVLSSYWSATFFGRQKVVNAKKDGKS